MSAQTSPRLVSLARRLLIPFLIVCGVTITLAGGYGVFLSASLSLPKSDEHPPLLIYGAPFFLQAGTSVKESALIDRLHRLGYRSVIGSAKHPGEYAVTEDALHLYLHAQ